MIILYCLVFLRPRFIVLSFFFFITMRLVIIMDELMREWPFLVIFFSFLFLLFSLCYVCSELLIRIWVLCTRPVACAFLHLLGAGTGILVKYIWIINKLNWTELQYWLPVFFKALPQVRVTPRLQSKKPGDEAKLECHATGEPFPKVSSFSSFIC